jgi:hypothetical protein
MSKDKLEQAYNSRSTRPIHHYWKLHEQKHGKDFDGELIRVALCGAKCRDDLLDANTNHLHGCGKCDEKKRARDRKVQP